MNAPVDRVLRPTKSRTASSGAFYGCSAQPIVPRRYGAASSLPRGELHGLGGEPPQALEVVGAARLVVAVEIEFIRIRPHPFELVRVAAEHDRGLGIFRDISELGRAAQPQWAIVAVDR